MTRYYCSGCDEEFSGNSNKHLLPIEDATGKPIGKRLIEGTPVCPAGHGHSSIEVVKE